MNHSFLCLPIGREQWWGENCAYSNNLCMLILKGISPISQSAQQAITLFILCPSFSWWTCWYWNSNQHPLNCFITGNKLKNIKSRFIFHTTKHYWYSKSCCTRIMKISLVLVCSIITFNTIPPGNKSTAPTHPPDSPPPPLSIRPLNSSDTPLLPFSSPPSLTCVFTTSQIYLSSSVSI